MIDFSLLLQLLSWERNWVETRRSVSRRVVDCIERHFFSRAVESVQLCWVSVKGYHVRGLFVESVHMVYMDRRGKRTYRMY
jgi:hypothetical protein